MHPIHGSEHAIRMFCISPSLGDCRTDSGAMDHTMEDWEGQSDVRRGSRLNSIKMSTSGHDKFISRLSERARQTSVPMTAMMKTNDCGQRKDVENSYQDLSGCGHRCSLPLRVGKLRPYQNTIRAKLLVERPHFIFPSDSSRS